MSTAELRLSLIERIMRMKKSALQNLAELAEETESIDFDALHQSDSISIEQYNLELKESETQIESGKYLTQSEVEERFRK